MRRLVLLIFCFILPAIAFCQDKLSTRIDSLIGIPDYAAAKKLIENSRLTADPRGLTRLSNRLAELSILQGKLDEAESELKEINSLGDPFLEAITKTNLGFLYLNKARNDLALEYLQQALTLFQSSGQGNTREAAKCLPDALFLSRSRAGSQYGWTARRPWIVR